MKRLLPLCLFLTLATLAAASDQVRNVQTELKDQGFYYGEVSGNTSPELTAAIRRYQIRNGLEVTGELSAETLQSLGVSGGAPVAKTKPTAPAPHDGPPPITVTPPAANRPPATENRPPVNLRRTEEVARQEERRLLEEDRNRPMAREPRQDRSTVPPPAPLDEEPTVTGGGYANFFGGTPYATAPRALQEQTVRRAQTLLAARGYYRDAVDGAPGPAMEEAILTYQRSARLPLTGRLDLQTLAQLRLLPGRGPGNPPLRPFNAAPDRAPRQVYRGVWVE